MALPVLSNILSNQAIERGEMGGRAMILFLASIWPGAQNYLYF